MKKYMSVEDFWNRFAAGSLKGLPKEHPAYQDFKLTYYAAMMDLLSYQHNILGAPETPEEMGAVVLQGWTDEIQSFLGNHPRAKARG